MAGSDYVQICISEKPTGRLAWAKARHGTASGLGWLDEFKTVQQHRADQHPQGLVYFRTRSKDRGQGGRRVILYFSGDRYRPGPGGRIQFKLGSTCSLFDQAELLHFTKGDWKHYTTPAGPSRSRCEWEAIYNAGRF